MDTFTSNLPLSRKVRADLENKCTSVFTFTPASERGPQKSHIGAQCDNYGLSSPVWVPLWCKNDHKTEQGREERGKRDKNCNMGNREVQNRKEERKKRKKKCQKTFKLIHTSPIRNLKLLKTMLISYLCMSMGVQNTSIHAYSVNRWNLG